MKSFDELRAIREKISNTSRLQDQKAETKIIVGMGTCGIAAGARNVLTAIIDELATQETKGIIVSQTGCLGMCEKEPLLEVQTPHGKTLYGYVNADLARRVIASHTINGQPIVELMMSRD